MRAAPLDRGLRALPIGWRIALVISLNLLVALAVAGFGWLVAEQTGEAMVTIRQEQDHTAALLDLSLRASRAETLVHHYFAMPQDDLLKQAARAADDLFRAMEEITGPEAGRNEDEGALQAAAHRFFAAFQALKRVDANRNALFEGTITPVLEEMSSRYLLLESGPAGRSGGAAMAAICQSHHAFVAVLGGIDALMPAEDPNRSEEARRRLGRLVDSFRPLSRLAVSAVDRDGIATLHSRANQLASAIEALDREQRERQRLLSAELNPSQQALSAAADRLVARSQNREAALWQHRRDQMMESTLAGAVGTVVLLAFTTWLSLRAGLSVRQPLIKIRNTIQGWQNGDWHHEIARDNGRDEVGAIARLLQTLHRQILDLRRSEAERAEAARHAAEARQRLLSEVFAQIEAQAAGETFMAPSLTSDGETATIARAFERVLAGARAAVAAREAERTVLMTECAAAETRARENADLLEALITAVVSPAGPGDAGVSVDRLTLARECGRFDRSETALAVSAADPAAAILAAPSLARTLTRQGAEALTLWVDPGLPSRCQIDPTRLTQLVALLIDSVAAEGGRVQFAAERLGPEDQPSLRLWAVGEGDANGPLAVLDQSLARLIAGRLGGRLEQVAPVAGSAHRALWCRLPLVPVSSASAPLAETEAVRLMAARVLVVAPSAEERRLIAQVAEQAGAAVIRVSGGEEAIAAVAKANLCRAPFDLVFAATVALAPGQLAALAPAPWLLIDDEMSPPARRMALQAGAGWVGGLGRPLDPAQILLAMAKAIRSSPDTMG